MRKNKIANFTAILAAVVLLSGCGSIGLAREETFESNYENGEETGEDIYVSATDVIVRNIDTEAQIMDFYVTGSSDQKSLYYDGATIITDRYGQPMVASQLQPGDMVKVAYNSGIGKAGVVQLNPEVFTLSDISRYTVEDGGRALVIGDDVYNIDEHARVFSNGEEIDLQRLVIHDVLTVQGKDRTVMSIRVDEGHGYLELKHEKALIGGWIEVGQAVISQVADDMLFTVPEGDYRVRLTNTGIEEYRDISIRRNEITELDLSDIRSAEPEKGRVSFEITPEDAKVEVDDNEIRTAYAVKLPIGMHRITVSAQGYATVTQYFEVDGLNQTVKIDLESITASTVSANRLTSPSASPEPEKNDPYLYASITVEVPEGADLYEDNLYKGIIPVTYQKTPGTHILTIRKNGYETTSYTIIIDNDGQDVTYRLPDMEPEDGNGDSASGKNSTVSGNRLGATPSPSPTPRPDMFPKADQDLLWEEDLDVLSEEGLRQALSQLEKYVDTDRETAILRENIIRIKKQLREKHGVVFEDD
ncbi:MAG: PEGA domain-containing protein [Lachnospiraceae bacterium]|nr:PEGA domain-containing protein [Lachnospiraceae bacterium]